MRFSVSADKDVVQLSDNETGCAVEVYTFGALLNKFSVMMQGAPVNVVDGFDTPAAAKAQSTDGFKSAKLSPFVCRIQDGRYNFNDKTYAIDKFYLGASAIHGLLFDQEFLLQDLQADDTKAVAVLQFTYDKKDEGFPFAYSIQVAYALQPGNNLTLTTTVTNISGTDMPLNDGWHPYFKLGHNVNDLLVQFNSRRLVEFNADLIPTGNYLPYNEFNKPQILGDTFFDNCFELASTGTFACTLKNPENGLQLDIIPGNGYPYLQIYTPPHRASIAIENLSSIPDAFNNGIGLVTAKTGIPYVFATTYRLSLS